MVSSELGVVVMKSLYQRPEGCHQYTDLPEVPWDVRKFADETCQIVTRSRAYRYWHQRYSIFSKYDDGIWMTDDAWFGVTPEPVAW